MSKNKIQNKPLGRGLSSLLGDKKDISHLILSESKNKLKTLSIDLISPGPWQARNNFEKNDLINLSKSIKNNGLIQPIVVTEDKKNKGNFLIIAGERRWRATQLAKIHEIPVIIKDDLKDNKILEISLLENLQRSDLNPIEEANGYRGLIASFNYSQDKVASVVGKSRPYVTNILRLLTLPVKVQDYLINEKLTVGHVRALIGRDDSIEIANEILKNKLTVRDVERLIKFKEKKITPRSNHNFDLENELSEKTGLNVKIKYNNKTNRGSVTFLYDNLDQLDHFINKIK